MVRRKLHGRRLLCNNSILQLNTSAKLHHKMRMEVKERIPEKANFLKDDILAHRKDPYKKTMTAFLYFEFLSYRVAYQVTDAEVFIVRVRHTGMEPELY